jgi:hypothetical protein
MVGISLALLTIQIVGFGSKLVLYIHNGVWSLMHGHEWGFVYPLIQDSRFGMDDHNSKMYHLLTMAHIGGVNTKTTDTQRFQRLLRK